MLFIFKSLYIDPLNIIFKSHYMYIVKYICENS